MTWQVPPDVPPLPAASCQVWWASPADATPALERLLDGAESERHGRLRRAADRDRLTVGVALAKTVLAAHLGQKPAAVAFDRTCTSCGEPHGKPSLVGADLQFSVSHSGERVAVAVSAGPAVGVDVEKLNPSLDVTELSAGVLTAAEREVWSALPEPERLHGFFTYWSRKEAVLKATADGLSVPLDTLQVSGPGTPPRLERWDARPEVRSRLYGLHPGDGYVGCLAALTDANVTVHELDGGPLLKGPHARSANR